MNDDAKQIDACDLAPVAARVLRSLAGFDFPKVSYEDLEKTKQIAADVRGCADAHTADKAVAVVCHAWAHWIRALDVMLTQWSASYYDEMFPNGVRFNEYLCAWLHSVGVPSLKVSPEELHAIYRMTGCAPLPHDEMPVGKSMFTPGLFAIGEAA